MKKEILELIRQNQPFYFASFDGNRPYVRPFGFVMIYQDQLCFCTNNQKKVFAQLAANPWFEICTTPKDGEWLRLSGKAVFITSRDTKQAAFDASAFLSSMYSVDDDILEIFTISDAKADYCSMKGTIKTITL